MKVICNRGALLEALTVAGNVVAARTPKPVLQCVKLTAADDRLTIAATDLEVAIRYSDSQVQIEQAGETLVPADKLRDIVRESVDDTLSIEVTGDNANIRGQDSHFKIFTQNAGEFPPVPDFEGEADFEDRRRAAQAAHRADALRRREGIDALCVQRRAAGRRQGKEDLAVSTDGRRLAQAKGDLISGKAAIAKDGAKAIIPAKALTLIDKLIDDPGRSRRVPDAREPGDLPHLQRDADQQPRRRPVPAVRGCDPQRHRQEDDRRHRGFSLRDPAGALLTTEESKGVRLQFTKKGLVLTSRSPEAGEATVNFACKFEGSDVEIGFNPQFLTEALRVVDSDEITLELTAANRPGLLKGGPNFLYVIMPVNLQ